MSSRQQAIYEDIFARLARGEWQVGERLPAIAQLQEHYGVPGLNTVRHAQQRLVVEGYLRSEQGRGVYVAAIPDVKVATRASDDRVAAALAKVQQARRLLAEVEQALTSRTA